MHLIVPYASARSDAYQQVLQHLELSNLARLLARLSADRCDSADEYTLSPPHERAYARALNLGGGDGRLPWAAWLARRDGIDPQDRPWGLLTPVHWHVGLDHVVMTDPKALAITKEESRALLESVRQLFESEGWTLTWGAPTRWYAAHESLADLPTASLDRVIGRNVDAWLPASPQARLIRRLQNEVQMLLYNHPVNDARVDHGAKPVNSFWLSGCGRAATPVAPRGLVYVDDLRDALLSDDWVGWAQAWQRLDAGPIRQALQAAKQGEAVELTLCGERAAQHFASVPQGLWTRLTRGLRSSAAERWLAAL